MRDERTTHVPLWIIEAPIELSEVAVTNTTGISSHMKIIVVLDLI
jgi:hypothetical protein